MTKKTDKAEKHSSPFLKRILKRVSKETQQEISNRMAIAVKIHEGMLAKGLAKKRFATLMKQPPSVISRWLSGTHNFTVDTLTHIQSKLNIRLLDIEESKPIVERVYGAKAGKEARKESVLQGGEYTPSGYTGNFNYYLGQSKFSLSTK